MKKVLGDKKAIAIFVLPAFFIYAVFALIPIGYNIYVSFLQTDLMSPSQFVGLKNYMNLFKVFRKYSVSEDQRKSFLPDGIFSSKCYLRCGGWFDLDLCI